MLFVQELLGGRLEVTCACQNSGANQSQVVVARCHVDRTRGTQSFWVGIQNVNIFESLSSS